MKRINNIISEILTDYKNDKTLLSSEKTLVFQFAWNMMKNLEKLSNLKILFDFENSDILNGYPCNIRASIDLLLIIKTKNCERKIGIEFKYPKSSINGGANTKESRVEMIEDIKRILWARNQNRIDYGFIIWVTDLNDFICKGCKRKLTDFATYHNIRYKKGEKLPISKNSQNYFTINKEISLYWNNIIEVVNKSSTKFEINKGELAYLVSDLSEVNITINQINNIM